MLRGRRIVARGTVGANGEWYIHSQFVMPRCNRRTIRGPALNGTNMNGFDVYF